jgi:hypothetical protein
VASRPIRPFWPRAAKQAEPAHQAAPSSPSSLHHRAGGTAASSSRAAAPWAPRCPSPMPWSDRNDCAPLNSVVCFYSDVNTPLFTTGNRRLHGRPLKPPAPPPPSGPIKGGGLHSTLTAHPPSPPLLSEVEHCHLRAPLPPPTCRRCPATKPPSEPG